MKILPFKLFESESGEIIFNDIKDAFQDIIDEYNIEKVPLDTGLIPEGISYHFVFMPECIDTGDTIFDDAFQIELYVKSKNSDLKRKYLEIFDNMKDDLSKFLDRCRKMGFRVVVSGQIALYNNGPFSIRFD